MKCQYCHVSGRQQFFVPQFQTFDFAIWFFALFITSVLGRSKLAFLALDVCHTHTRKSLLFSFRFFLYAEIANCGTDIAFFAERLHKDTRQWLFEDFNTWFSKPGDSRAYVLLGDAGVGKSVMAGALAQRMMKARQLGAAYFCRHYDSTRNDPGNLFGTIACQLCDCNSEYSSRMGGEDGVKMFLANSNLGVQELCTKLLEEPLSKCKPFQQRRLVVIDALDETEYKSRKGFIFLVKEHFPRLPEWLLFFITSRPEDMLQSKLEKYNPCVRICAGNGEQHSFYQRHEQDIQRFLDSSVDFSRFPLRKTLQGSVMDCSYMLSILRENLTIRIIQVRLIR